MHVDAKQIIICVLLHQLFFISAVSIHQRYRVKRGLLSKTGICPIPTENYNIKDTRLNFFGIGYQLPGDENPPCGDTECYGDGHCEGDHKCCKNHCGAFICTEAVRAPHPCEMFPCPATKVCKIERVKCIDPVCPDMYAISRPICVQGGPIYQLGKRSRIPRPNIFAYQQQQQQQQRSNIRDDVQFQPAKPYYKPPRQ